MQLTYLLSEINFMGPAVNFVNEKINVCYFGGLYIERMLNNRWYINKWHLMSLFDGDIDE